METQTYYVGYAMHRGEYKWHLRNVRTSAADCEARLREYGEGRLAILPVTLPILENPGRVYDFIKLCIPNHIMPKSCVLDGGEQ